MEMEEDGVLGWSLAQQYNAKDATQNALEDQVATLQHKAALVVPAEVARFV